MPGGIRVEFEKGTLSNVLRVLEGAKLKDQNRELWKIHFEAMVPIKTPIISSAPADKNLRLRAPWNFSFEERKNTLFSGILGEIVGGYSSDAFMARFLEKGTRVRQGRGKIQARNFIARQHILQINTIINKVAIGYQNLYSRHLRRLNQR
jgi:hypothetical protein